jgi:plastocyanin
MSDRRLDTELRDRAVLPVLIPVVAIVVTEIVVFSMSRILLTAGKTPAVVIALVVAVGILVGAAGVAFRPRLRTSSIVGLLVLAGLAVVVAGAYAAQRGPFYAGEETEGGAVTVGAANLAFDTDLFELPVGSSKIEFVNEDTVQHNIAIFPDEDSLDEALFRGRIIDGGQKVTYEVELEAGTYYFHCDVHPTDMTGSVEVGGSGE